MTNLKRHIMTVMPELKYYTYLET